METSLDKRYYKQNGRVNFLLFIGVKSVGLIL
jgi:hypothetical protein